MRVVHVVPKQGADMDRGGVRHGVLEWRGLCCVSRGSCGVRAHGHGGGLFRGLPATPNGGARLKETFRWSPNRKPTRRGGYGLWMNREKGHGGKIGGSA